MSVAKFNDDLRQAGIHLSVTDSDQLKLIGPKSAVTPDVIGRIKACKAELLAYLKALPVQNNHRIAVYRVVINGAAMTVLDPTGQTSAAFEAGIRERFSHYQIDDIVLNNPFTQSR